MYIKGQIWYMDVMFALVIFSTALILFFKADINFLDSQEDILDDMDREARLLSDSIISSGYPQGWEESNVIEIGLIDDYRINETKLEYLGRIGYNETKSMLRTKYEYYLVFEDNDGIDWINSSHEGFGMPGINSTNIVDGNPDHLLKIIRFVIFRSEPRRMVVYLWQ